MERPYRDKEWLYDKYWDEGLSQKEIGELCGVSQGTISDWLIRHDIETKDHSGKSKNEPWKDRDTFLKVLKENNWHAENTADQFGLSKAAVSRWMDRHGIKAYWGGLALPLRHKNDHGRVYECFHHRNPDGGKFVMHHRLLATLLVDDLSELDGMHVHHSKYDIPWLTYEDNLEVVTPGEHNRRHDRRGDN